MTGPRRLGFACAPDGTVAELLLSEAVSRAYDIMTADGVPQDRAADMAVATERAGKDPVALAEHFVKLRRTFRREHSHRFGSG